MLEFNFFPAQNDKILCLEPESEPPFFVWSRSRLNWVRAGVGSGTLGFRSWCRSRPKTGRLGNIVWNINLIVIFCNGIFYVEIFKPAYVFWTSDVLKL